MAYFVLVRHGQNEWVKKQLLAGRLPNVHLDEEGLAQARAAAEKLSPTGAARVISSPLERCVETANPIAARLNIPVEVDDALLEIDYGSWQGRPLKELKKEKEWPLVLRSPGRARFPSGETFRDAQRRVVDLIDRLWREDNSGRFVLVSHGDLIKLALAHFMGLGIDQFQCLYVAPGSISAFAVDEGGFVRILKINETGGFQLPEKDSDS